ncbi:MAG: hypothetical protein ACE147_12850 [Candidatus Methylomirabilales bacterium]
MGGIDVWEIESSTEAEAARGRSPQARLVARHRGVSTASGILPGQGLQRLCDLTWFPRFITSGEARARVRLYQVQGIEGMQDGVYGPPPDPSVKPVCYRWFGSLT